MVRTVITIALDWPSDEINAGGSVIVTPVRDDFEPEPVPGEIIKVDIYYKDGDT